MQAGRQAGVQLLETRNTDIVQYSYTVYTYKVVLCFLSPFPSKLPRSGQLPAPILNRDHELPGDIHAAPPAAPLATTDNPTTNRRNRSPPPPPSSSPLLIKPRRPSLLGRHKVVARHQTSGIQPACVLFCGEDGIPGDWRLGGLW